MNKETADKIIKELEPAHPAYDFRYERDKIYITPKQSHVLRGMQIEKLFNEAAICHPVAVYIITVEKNKAVLVIF